MKTILAPIAMLLASISTAQTHETAKGPNGGPVVDTGSHHVEMVAVEDELLLYVADAVDAPLSTAGTTAARAIIQDAGQTTVVPLEAREPNMLAGVLGQSLAAGAKVVVSFKLPDGGAVQARFVKN